MIIQPKSKLLMIGDSITDCGRDRPIGEGLFSAYGNGYVSIIHGLLGSIIPEYQIRVMNMGISGNTVRDLKSRWHTDVIDLKPDWLSIMIGINDVWRQFDSPLQTEWHVFPDEYEYTLDWLVTQTLPALKGLVLISPYFIEPNPDDPMRKMMDQYGLIVKMIASKHRCIFVDTQKAFNKVLEHIHPMTIAWDRVHPTISGHMVLAKAFLDALEFPWKE